MQIAMHIYIYINIYRDHRLAIDLYMNLLYMYVTTCYH